MTDIGVPVSHTEALQIARHIVKLEEWKRLEAAEAEAEKGVQYVEVMAKLQEPREPQLVYIAVDELQALRDRIQALEAKSGATKTWEGRLGFACDLIWVGENVDRFDYDDSPDGWVYKQIRDIVGQTALEEGTADVYRITITGLKVERVGDG